MIEVREALTSSVVNLRSHALRSALSVLGIIFGVGAVIAMLSIGAGAEKEALEIIDAMGLRNVIVRDKVFDRDDEKQEIRKKSAGLSLRDAEAIRDAVPGVESVIARIEVDPWKTLTSGGRAKPKVVGVSHQYPHLVRLPLREGRFFDQRDEETYAQVCVIGDGVRRELFGFDAALGRPLKINDTWLTVIGVLAPRGGPREVQGVTLAATENDVYLPVTVAERKFGRPPLKSPLDELIVSMAPGAPVQESSAVISSLLDRLHGGAADYTITVPEALLEQSRKTQRLFDIVMGTIAGISLLVGGIGIMNIMLATVLERTREIGVRRATGARRNDIVRQFLTESVLISVGGGMLGIAFGYFLSWLIARTAEWKTIVTPSSIFIAFGVSVAVGMIFGIYPAVKASRIDPIEALRYE
jgi:putative ABC transport system permease protein